MVMKQVKAMVWIFWDSLMNFAYFQIPGTRYSVKVNYVGKPMGSSTKVLKSSVNKISSVCYVNIFYLGWLSVLSTAGPFRSKT